LWFHIYPGAGGFLDKRILLVGLLTNGTMGYQPSRMYFFGGGRQWYREFEFQSTWQELWMTLNATGKFLWITGTAKILAASMALFIISIFLGATYVQRTWQYTPTNAIWENLRKKYFTPKYGVTTLRKRLRGSLNRNPIGWLHHYSPSARLTKWFWCLFLLGIEMWLARDSGDLYTAQAGIGLLLIFGLVFSSTASFRNELETGAFELLLVTPIREGQILFGRVAGIWQQFLPAFFIYTAGVLFLASGWSDEDRIGVATESISWLALLFLSAPFIGLYFSLVRWNFLMAWLCASILTILLPILVRSQIEARFTDLPGHVAAPNFQTKIIIGQLCLAAFFAWRIRRRLQNRLALSTIAHASRV
jgi:hypothetical protein